MTTHSPDILTVLHSPAAMSTVALADPQQTYPPPQDPDNLRKQTLEGLEDEEKNAFDFDCSRKLDVLNDILVSVEDGKKRCLVNRWKHKVGNKEIIIHDKLEKMMVWRPSGMNTLK